MTDTQSSTGYVGQAVREGSGKHLAEWSSTAPCQYWWSGGWRVDSCQGELRLLRNLEA